MNGTKLFPLLKYLCNLFFEMAHIFFTGENVSFSTSNPWPWGLFNGCYPSADRDWSSRQLHPLPLQPRLPQPAQDARLHQEVDR